MRASSGARTPVLASEPIPVEGDQRLKPGREQALEAVRTLIAWAGDDPTRPGLIDTPKRVVGAYAEWFEGHDANPGVELSRTFEDVTGYDDMVVLRQIEVESHCEHHMAPFLGKAFVAYMPGEKVVCISKLARVVEIFAKRLQNQETLTNDIVEAIESHLSPKGVAVLIDAEHQCMTTRGVHHRLDLSDFELGLAAGAVETGVLDANTIFLIQSGFPSRSGAQIAVDGTGARFDNLTELRAWTRMPQVSALSANPAWPTPETHDLWKDFLDGLRPERIETWSRQDHHGMVIWSDQAPPDGTALRIAQGSDDAILDVDHQKVGTLMGRVSETRGGLLQATARQAGIDLAYLGPDDLEAVVF